MIAVRYEPRDADDVDREIPVASFTVTANGQTIGTVSSTGRVDRGWRAVAVSGTVLPGLFRKRSDAGDALVERSGILE